MSERDLWPSKTAALENAGRCSVVASVAWDSALEWAAGQVEAAGCICVGLNGAQEYDREFSGPPGFTFEGKLDFHLADPVVEHDPRCPVALAAKIREGAP